MIPLAARLAWRQLRHEPSRLAVAVLGVGFAALLVLMQLGFSASLYDSATNLLRHLQADLFLIQPKTTVSFRPEPFPRVRVHQTLADPDVMAAYPVSITITTWRNPQNGERRPLQLVGLDPDALAGSDAELAALAPALRAADTIAFDRLARPDFGDVAALLAERGPFEATLGHRSVTVAGLVTIGASFGADAHALTNEQNFRRIARDRPAGVVDLGLIRLRPGADRLAVQARLAAILEADVRVMTHAEVVAFEKRYWEESSPIGIIFGFGSLMGLVVGLVVVYQILFSDISAHMSEYATLKAMGYSNAYLGWVVLAAAGILAGLGFLPGLAAAWWCHGAVAGATGLPMVVAPGRALLVLGLVFGMCALAGLLAMRRLRAADPASLF